MHKALKWAGLLFIFTNLILCAWSLLHGDIYYYTDIARDLLLMDEIAIKKLVLIGPRADARGIFHGILWHYLNMPVYLVGRGNPLVMGWWWILLTAGLLASSYVFMKNLFDKKSAFIGVLILSAAMVPIAQGFFHGNGAMLILPAFFYFFVRYMQTKDVKHLLVHLIVAGCVVQFELAIGVPLLMLSGLALLYLIIKSKKFIHILAYQLKKDPKDKQYFNDS